MPSRMSCVGESGGSLGAGEPQPDPAPPSDPPPPVLTGAAGAEAPGVPPGPGPSSCSAEAAGGAGHSEKPETRSVCSNSSGEAGGGGAGPICKICFQGAEQVSVEGGLGQREVLAGGESAADWDTHDSSEGNNRHAYFRTTDWKLHTPSLDSRLSSIQDSHDSRG